LSRISRGVTTSGAAVSAKVINGRDAGTIRCRWSCESAVWLSFFSNTYDGWCSARIIGE
jgi:hypothetical protein